MAIVMTMRWATIAPEDYEAAREVVGWETDPPAGGRHHIAWFDGGLNVVDVWDSEQEFQRFADERLMPGLAGAGLLEGKDEPEIKIAPLHRQWSPDRQEVLT
jgi:hypothetical protein